MGRGRGRAGEPESRKTGRGEEGKKGRGEECLQFSFKFAISIGMETKENKHRFLRGAQRLPLTVGRSTLDPRRIY